MPLTIGELLRLPHLDLRLRSGTPEQLAHTVDWAAVTEFADPSPSLTGGEIVLTTGMRLLDEADCRRFVRSLERIGSRAIGFGNGTGLGFTHTDVPPALLEAAAAAGLPLFEVPVHTTFATITRTVAEVHSAEQFARIETQHRMHQHLVELLLGDGGLDAMLARLGRATNAHVALSRNGEILHGSLEVDDPRLTGWDALPIAVGPNSQATLHISKPRREEALVASARSLIGLHLAQTARRLRTEREQAGQVFADLIGGRLTGDLVRGRLQSIGVDTDRRARLMVVSVAPTDRRHRELASVPLPATLEGATAGTIDGDLVVAIDDRERARAAAEALIATMRTAGIPARVGIGGAYPATPTLRWSWFEARDALEKLADGEEIAEASRLSIAALVLGAQEAPVAELAAQVLGPLEEHDAEHGTSLVATLDAFLAFSGATHEIAHALGTHRNTVRYRIDQIARLTGLDPRVSADAVQLTLARMARRITER